MKDFVILIPSGSCESVIQSMDLGEETFGEYWDLETNRSGSIEVIARRQ